MPTLVTRFALTGTEEEVSPARRLVVAKVRAWGVPLDEETADVICLVASELITNAVIHGGGPITVTLCHRPGTLMIDVLDANTRTSKVNFRDVEEGGRGLLLVGFLAARSGWEPVMRGKRVWVEIALPKSAPAVRAAVLRRFFAVRPGPHGRTVPEALALAIA
ncbi:ATP-binding protein [Streptomyces sp. NPDC051994]|uniref:ATP-binding protein n=1 Tax=unclassified Streptomyces TaxID=2593676 RepID=UPI0034477B58